MQRTFASVGRIADSSNLRLRRVWRCALRQYILAVLNFRLRRMRWWNR